MLPFARERQHIANLEVPQSEVHGANSRRGGLRCNGGANAENSDGDGYVAVVVVVVVAKGRHHCCGWVSLNRKKGAGCLGRGRERVVVCEGEVGGGLVVVG